jgi:hypothetical protein
MTIPDNVVYKPLELVYGRNLEKCCKQRLMGHSVENL